MSGIAGIVVPAGRVVDEQLLRRMAEPMTRCGCDAHHTWIDGRAGLAHAPLGTRGVDGASHPQSLDGNIWITADARIDGRAELVRSLEAAGRTDVKTSDAGQLILHAYHAWGERCVDRLIGDFAFAIWDRSTGQLFCARDHFGAKPFYYAHVDGAFVFSNTLDCVRRHPGVGRALNELWMADFLLFGFNHDTSATAFAQVHRLAPAHVLRGSPERPLVRRYWTLPADGRIRYRRSRDYVEHFVEVLRQAVDDRINGNASIWLSGGLDSTAIAVTAQQVLASRGTPIALNAHTVVYDTLMPDEERHYAALAGRAAGIEPRFWPADGAAPFAGWEQREFHTPEPIEDPFFAFQLRQLQEMGLDSAAVLTGDGGDELLWRSYATDLFGAMPLWEFGTDLARCALVHRRRPAAGVRAMMEARRTREAPSLPGWLNPDLADRWQLRDRLADGAAVPSPAGHPLRPEAHARLRSPAWPAFLEQADPGFTGIAVEHRRPFLDLRVVNYALAIPPLPWCVDKEVLRLAMRAALPAPLLHRKKSPLADDPLRVHLQRGDWSWLDRFEASPQLARFVDRAAVPPVARIAAGENPWPDLRPFCLNYWLSRLDGRMS